MKIAYKVILFTLLLLSSPLTLALELDEGFVFLKIAKFKGNKFYRVLLSEDEIPYIDVVNIMSEYLDMADVHFDRDEQYCSGVQNPEGIKYWINAKTLTHGNSNVVNDITLPLDGAIVKEGKVWLRYDLLSNWLNVSSDWSLNQYILSITPKFKLLYQKKEQIKIRRESHAQKKKEFEKIESMKPIESDSNLTTQAKVLVEVERPLSQATDDIVFSTNAQTTTDLYKGTLYLDGSASTNSNEMTEYYWNYRTNDRLGLHLIEAGDTTVDRTSLLIPTVGIKHGLKVQRLKSGIKNGLYTVKGRAPKGSEVDIFHNGILVKSITVKEDGAYEVKDLLVAGSDSITTEILYPDGRDETIQEKITPDKSIVLPRNTFNFSGVTGIKPNSSSVYYANLRYGLLPNLTTGVHYIFDAEEMEKGVTIVDVAWRPFASALFLYESAAGSSIEENQTIDHSIALNLEMIKYNFFQFRFFNINNNSPILYNKSLTRGISKQLLHKLSFYNFLWENRINQTDENFTAQSTLTKVIGRKLNISLMGEQESLHGDNEIDSLSTRISYSPSLTHRLTFNQQLISSDKVSSFEYEYRDRNSVRPLNGKFSISRSESSKYTGFGEGSWNFTKKLALAASTDGEDFGIKLSFVDVFSPIGKSISSRKEYKQGIIYGKVIPPLGTASNFSLENIEVKAGRLKAMADRDGNYILKGVHTHAPLKVFVEPNSMDITMVQKDEFKLVKLRPATNLQLDIILSNSVGLDGVLVSNKGIPPGTKIEVINISNEKKVKEVEVEEDGFFLIENIPAGEHELRLITLPEDRTAPTPKRFSIQEGEDWLSDLKWDWD